MYKIFKLLFVVMLLGVGSIHAANEEAVRNYTTNLIQTGQSLLQNNQLAEADRISKAKELIANNLDLKWMAKYTLGKYRRNISEEHINAFTAIYSQYVINSFTNLLRNYKGEKVVIKNVKSLGENLKHAEYFVQTTIKNPQDDKQINVNYSIREIDNNHFYCFDVVTEGISMINSQQKEFDNTLSQTDGLNLLMSKLKQKI